jgi:hypothetical protein
MKKFTFLTVIAFAVSLSANAAWNDKITPVDKASAYVRSMPMAMDAEGNTIVTAPYNGCETFTFGNSKFKGQTENDAFVAKYDSEGNQKWVRGFNGNVRITAVTTDPEGTIYVAGKFASDVIVGEAYFSDGTEDNTTRYSSFIVKINKNGYVDGHMVIVPTKDTTLLSGGLMEMIELNTTISHIESDGKKVYFSLSYNGDVTVAGLSLQGHYKNAFDYYLMNATTSAIVSLDAYTLGSPEVVVSVGATERVVTDVYYCPEDVCFTLNNGIIYAGFIAEGTVGVTTPSGTTKVSLDYDAYGSIEHAFLFVKVDGTKSDVKVYHTTATDATNLSSIDQMRVIGGYLVVAGTFNVKGLFGGLQYQGGSDMFVATLNSSNFNLTAAKSTQNNEGESKKCAEVVTSLFNDGARWALTGYAENTADHSFINPLAYTVVLPSCEMEYSTSVYITAAAENDNYVSVQAASDSVTYFYSGMARTYSGLEEVVANPGKTIQLNGDNVVLSAAADINVYNINGALVKDAKAATSLSLADLSKGMYIIKVGQKAIKFNK